MKEFDELVDIISKLRKECPWDKEQTHESLSKHLIEEAYELLDALAKLDNKEESIHNLKTVIRIFELNEIIAGNSSCLYEKVFT